MHWAKTKMFNSAGKQHKENSEKSETWKALNNSLAEERSFYLSVADVLKSMSIIHSRALWKRKQTLLCSFFSSKTQFWPDSLLHSQDFLDNTSGDKE